VSLKVISLLQTFSSAKFRIYGTSCGPSASAELLVECCHGPVNAMMAFCCYKAITCNKIAYYLDVNEHWQKMNGNIMMETAQVTSGLSKGSCRHKETWW